MTRRPPWKKKPTKGEHFVLTEWGPYALPDLLRFEGIDQGRWLHIRVIRAFTGDLRLHIPLSVQAAASLLTAPEIEEPFATLTRGRPLNPENMKDPIEMPMLDRFVCFRGVNDQWRIAEFLTPNGERLLVSFSLQAYRDLLVALPATIKGQ